MKSTTAYSANLTGSDAYWIYRRQELEAIFQQNRCCTAIFRFSFADYYWVDRHRLMPGGLIKPNGRFRNVAKNSQLVDWYFSARLDDFFRWF